mgnify:CR=1 FL=1
MSRQYPIWNIITACIYKSGKSYGVKNTGEVEIRVGTSSSNSHTFLKHRVTHREDEQGNKTFYFYVDDVCFKKGYLKKGGELQTINNYSVNTSRNASLIKKEENNE